jgi:hypothetical protein
MKKIKQQYMINNQEDEDSSAYPLYPETEDIYNKEKKDGELSLDSNTGIATPSNKMIEWHDLEYEPDSKRNALDVPGAELDEEIGEEDEENNYYSIGGDNHNDLEEDKED